MIKLFLSCFFIPLMVNTGIAQHRPGIIEIYGLKKLERQQLLPALGLREGDLVTASAEMLREQLLKIAGVKDASVSFVCCEAGKEIIYIGISEEGAGGVKFRRIVGEDLLLPDTIQHLDSAFYKALNAAVLKGDSGDEFVNGYSLFSNREVRTIQLQFPAVADRYFEELTNVLQHAEDGEQRATAAMFIAYGSDKREVAAQLNKALDDPYPAVRNNVMRAFAALAKYNTEHAGLALDFRVEYIIELLQSVYWSDRDKAMFALVALTENREPGRLKKLEESSLPVLTEMCNWKARGHAMLACILLGRITGWPDAQIFESWKMNDGR